MDVWPQVYEPAIPLASLTPYPGNPRIGDVDLIAGSIRANGFYGALIVQASTRFVLVGNHRLLGAVAEGLDALPGLIVDCDDDDARRINLVDNRSTDLASYDVAVLARLLGGLRNVPGGLAGTGYDPDTVDLLLRQLAEGETAGLVGEGLTPSEREGLRSGAQSLVLPFASDVYERVVVALALVAAEQDCDRSTAVLRLAQHAVTLLVDD